MKHNSTATARRFGGALKALAIMCIAGLSLSAQAGIKKVKEGKYTWTLSVSGSTAMIGNGSETECAASSASLRLCVK